MLVMSPTMYGMEALVGMAKKSTKAMKSKCDQAGSFAMLIPSIINDIQTGPNLLPSFKVCPK